MTGFEPATPTSRTWCATGLRYIPFDRLFWASVKSGRKSKIYSEIKEKFLTFAGTGFLKFRIFAALRTHPAGRVTPAISRKTADYQPASPASL